MSSPYLTPAPETLWDTLIEPRLNKPTLLLSIWRTPILSIANNAVSSEGVRFLAHSISDSTSI